MALKISQFCRLGTATAEAYVGCNIDHWSKKREKSVEEKSVQAKECTHKYKNTAMQLLVHIYTTNDIGMVTQLVNGLRFVNDLFRQFMAEYFPNIQYPNSINLQCRVYYPLLQEMYQHDCHALLLDISGFVQCIEFDLPKCKSVVKVKKYIQLAHTIGFYLEQVKRG